jgi:predicted nucleotidyltransferase
MDSLSRKIVTTLTYYDVMDYPMTAFEVWKYLIKSQETESSDQEKTRLVDIIKELEGEEIKKQVEEYHGYFFLRGRKELVDQRIERNKIAETKFKRVRKIVWFLRFVPFVRMVAVTGTLAMKNTQPKSDLDLLVVLKRGHIFTGRTLVTALIHLLGVRRYGRKITNRICLNFFITDKSLEINLRDLFSSSEYFFIWPIFDLETFKKFQEANQWIVNYREHFQPESLGNLKLIKDSSWAKILREIGEIIFSFSAIEKYLKSWEMKRIMKDPRTHLPGSMVMADDNALIFLPKPQGPEIFENFQKKLKGISKT